MVRVDRYLGVEEWFMGVGSLISSVLVKPVSADCNLSCTYCFYLSKAELYPEVRVHRMSDEVLRELVAQVVGVSPGRVSFCWQGGEPTLAGLDFYRRVVEYQELFRAPGQVVENCLQTNGVLIDEEWARFLSRYGFLVGVSLDGPREFHDYYRRDRSGRGSYDRVMRGIGWLRKFGVEFNILVLLNDRNVKYPRKLYRFLVGQGFRYLQFIPCVERDPETGEIAGYSITPEEYGRFLCELFDEWTRGGVPDVYIRDFDDILISYVTGDSPSCIFGRECGRYVVIEYNGDVYPCDFYVEPDWFLGNIMEEPLEEILQKEKFKKFRSRKRELARRCEGCPWLWLCNGGCPRHWEVLGFSRNYFCSSYRRFFEYSHERFLKLKRVVELMYSFGVW